MEEIKNTSVVNDTDEQVTETSVTDKTESIENSNEEKEAIPEREAPFDINTDIVVDDGFVEKTIKNKYGKTIGVFGFKPTDLRIVDRYNTAVKRFESIIEPLKDVNISPDGTASNADGKAYEALKQAEERLYELCDYLLDGNMSEAFFGATHPFAPINGHFYCENVINAVGAFLGAYFDAETRIINKRVLQYTHGYKTGKHRKGKK